MILSARAELAAAWLRGTINYQQTDALQQPFSFA
jgi:hypothetical protein